jgi:hypothetical protein
MRTRALVFGDLLVERAEMPDELGAILGGDLRSAVAAVVLSTVVLALRRGPGSHDRQRGRVALRSLQGHLGEVDDPSERPLVDGSGDVVDGDRPWKQGPAFTAILIGCNSPAVDSWSAASMPQSGAPSRVHVAGGEAGSLVQLSRLTCTLASPAHVPEATASVITPPVSAIQASEADRGAARRSSCQRARAPAGSEMLVAGPEPVDAVVRDAHAEGLLQPDPHTRRRRGSTGVVNRGKAGCR